MKRGRLALLAAIWLGPSLCFVTLCGLIYGHFRIESRAPIAAGARADLLACLRDGLEGAATKERGTLATSATPMIVRVYLQGQVRARYQSSARTLLEACSELGGQMAHDRRLAGFTPAARVQARIRVDRVVGRGPLVESPSLLAAMALHPGLDGLGLSLGDDEVFFLPSELIDARLLIQNRPLDFVPDLVFGFDKGKAEPSLRALSGLDAKAFGERSKSYFRFRVEAFVEDEKGGVLALDRDLPPSPALSAQSLREGALDGGRYLVAHMSPSGRYIYKANLSSGQQSTVLDRGYSLPRHAGTTYFLAELYRRTGEDFLVEPIERAIGHLGELVEAANCRGTSESGAVFVCVADRGRAISDLGSTALAVVALAEYQRATGSTRFESLMLQMAEFLLHMQRADGSFAHRYNWQSAKIDNKTQLLYYSGEATLALARVHKVTGDERYLRATERGLDWLVSWYDFFLGGFFYGEEHWTCIAAEAAYPDLKKARYLDFCEGYGRFLRGNQPLASFQDQQAWSGAYYFTPFLAPQNTPAGSRSEAMISTFMLGRHHGKELGAIRDQVLAAMQYALSQQVRRDGLFRVPSAVSGLGAIPGGPIDRDVRIDYVQHVCSAMLRAIDLLEPDALGDAPTGVLGSEE